MDNLTPWKEALKERTLYGCFVTYGLPDIAEVTALMGFDFLLLDNEHGVIEQSTLADMVRASQLRGVPAVVRCTMKEYDHIQKALDFGANGVQLPLVNTAEDARRVVELANYAPQGRRGTAYLPRAARYGMVEDKRAYLGRPTTPSWCAARWRPARQWRTWMGFWRWTGWTSTSSAPATWPPPTGSPPAAPKCWS